MCGKPAQWLRFWAVNYDTMGSNPAKIVYIIYLFFTFVNMSTYPTNVENCFFFFKCVAIVATIFSLNSNGTLNFSFRHVGFLLDLVQIICK